MTADIVRVRVPREYLLRVLSEGRVITTRYVAGICEMPRAHFEHPWSHKNSVVEAPKKKKSAE